MIYKCKTELKYNLKRIKVKYNAKFNNNLVLHQITNVKRKKKRFHKHDTVLLCCNIPNNNFNIKHL